MKIIAEIGSNFRSLSECMRSIELAKECGADAVKFQHFSASEMWGSGKKEMTPETWLPSLKRCAEDNDISFGCSFFEPYKLCNHLGLLDFIKIASSNMMDTRLLDIAKRSEKLTLISTGGHHLFEVERVFNYFPMAKFLYCESVYPSNVNNLRKLNNVYFSGISDHSLDIYPSYDGDFIEKHVNLVDAAGTPDEGHALNVNQFTAFCTHLKFKINPALLSEEEHDMRTLHNVRLVAKTAIKKGTCFTWNNVGIYRGITACENYINPMDSDKVIGKVAAHHMKAWEPLGTGSIQTSQRKAKHLHPQH